MVLRKRLFTLALLLTLMLSPVQAQEGQPSQSTRDVRVVVDISGSMRVNDPDNLRRPAVRLIARLLPDGTSVGLWTFGRMVNMLVPHDTLGDELRATLIKDSEQINSIAQRTNIGGAIEKASDSWYAPDRSLARTHLILLSDGKVDISPNQARNDKERDRILEELVPRLAAQGLTIHTIALSGEADLDLLGAIADMTGGVARVADSAEELSRIFADTMGQAVPANEVPLEDNGFTVDGGVEEFTALIFSATPPDERELALVDPNGERYGPDNATDTVRWAREAGYDLITVDQPAAGKWQVEGTLGEGSRVTVVSDLRLEVEPMPARFQLGEEVGLRAFFTEEGERITDPDFLGVITVTLSMTTEDGRRGSRVLSEEQPPADGVYQDTIAKLPSPGQYLLELEADGSTFSRKFRKTLVLEAPENASPDAASDSAIPLEADTGTQPEEVGAEMESGPISDGPIDLSQLEEPVPAPKEAPVEPEPAVTEQSDDTPSPEADTAPEPAEAEPSLVDRIMAWWPWAAGALGAIILAGAVLLVLKRRGRGDDDNSVESAETGQGTATSIEEPEAEAAEDTEQGEVPEDPAPPIEPEEDETPEVAVNPDEPAEDEAGASKVDAAEEPPVIDGPQSPEPELPEEPEETKPRAEEGDSAERSQDALPDDDAVTGAEEAEPDEIPEQLPDDDDEEFGLEDFDLSDIDDLPDLETDEDENERDKPSDRDKKPKE